ncbi:DUF4256 domain-containing protein [Flavobacterium sedimenticola]|uniref:DUF4256 domain-containing protein n=1 Tax=Flavobacterium sedimenticola TaxID=3043286 RepID=A0ABT6XUL1_9FLAO|nr:DUF4256 domain-containing protein [Flavobacterium sedimenticola]MDI9258304.1 DUF4256 domain-containing protein [Flavobacterium sedimenticola]
MKTKKVLSQQQSEELIAVLKNRFLENKHRHPGMIWMKIEEKLQSSPEQLWSLHQMEATGGEPDVIDFDETNQQYHFYDCSAESPKGRRSYCYDREALDSRKENKPQNSVLDVATDMGITLLTENQYRKLQEVGVFDAKTSSWIATPPAIRKLGGALFGDRRYNCVFTYHNGAESYYAARGFRGLLKL